MPSDLNNSQLPKAGLDSIFRPASIAVVGASEKPGSVGGAVLANLKSAGFEGSLWAVNSRQGTVQGLSTISSIVEIPEKPDLVIVCTPATTVPGLLRECGQRGIRGMIVISAGFRETGTAGRELENKLIAASQEYPDVRFLGPNCLGLLRPAVGLNASFSPVMPSSGGITFLSQSGALCTAILDWSIERGIGFATCVSVGNMTNIGMGDLIDYFADDDQTSSILLYIEGLSDAPHFLEAAYRCTRKKPVIAYKAGRFAESSAAAASHTGAMASSDAIYEIAFRHAGIERAHSIEELFDCAKLLVRRHEPSGGRLAIVTNAGGPGVMATDAWLGLGGQLAKLNRDTMALLDRDLPLCWSHGNPIDVLGDATYERFQAAIRHTLADPGVDAALVIVTPQSMTQPDRIAQTVIEAYRQTNKPLIASWIGGPAMKESRRLLRDNDVPAYDFPEEATHALYHLISANRMRANRHVDDAAKVASSVGSEFTVGRFIPRERIEAWRKELAGYHGLLGESRSKELLAEYGIPTAITRIARTPEDAVQIAERMGFPVVLKIVSADISHKTDVGGVALNVLNADETHRKYVQMMDSVARNSPNSSIDGISVQRMITMSSSIELLVGMKRDPQFGAVLLVGAGGITAEIEKDYVLELPPFDETTIDEMLRSLRLFPLLNGYRGRSGVNLGLLKDAIVRFAQLVQDFPELSAAEINPLLVSKDGVMAVDARMICNEKHGDAGSET